MFKAPAGGYDWNKEDDCRRFAREYVSRPRAEAVDVIALANHNRAGPWIDYIRDASGDDLTVFPGVEITSGSGKDGIHLIIIGDPDDDVAKFEALLSSTCGFNSDHPPLTGDGKPLSSPKSALDILSALPDDVVVIAPHVLNDNGIASGNSIEGDLRWKLLHHSRIVLDPSSPADNSVVQTICHKQRSAARCATCHNYKETYDNHSSHNVLSI